MSIKSEGIGSFHDGTTRTVYRHGKIKLLINLSSKMTVIEQIWEMPLFNLITEIGGIVGLFLGYCILDLRDLIKAIVTKFNLK